MTDNFLSSIYRRIYRNTDDLQRHDEIKSFPDDGISTRLHDKDREALLKKATLLCSIRDDYMTLTYTPINKK